jgi:hypothetical protein
MKNHVNKAVFFEWKKNYNCIKHVVQKHMNFKFEVLNRFHIIRYKQPDKKWYIELKDMSWFDLPSNLWMWKF